MHHQTKKNNKEIHFCKNLAKTILSIFLMLSLSATEGHATVDSLRQIWTNEAFPDSIRFRAVNEFYKRKANAEPSAVLELANQHQALADEKNAPQEKAIAINHKITALKLLGEYDLALKELSALEKINKREKDTIGLANVYRRIGIMYHYKSKYADAENYLSNSIALYEEKRMDAEKAGVLSSLAILYSELNNFDLSMEYFADARQVFQSLGLEDDIDHLSLNHGFTHFEKKNYAEAIANGQRSMEYFKASNHQVGLADSYYLLAQAHKALNQTDLAMDYIKKSLDINLSIGNPGQIIPTKLLYADIVFDIETSKAEQIGEELLPVVDTSYGYAYLTQLYHLLYRCYKAKGDVNNALNMHEKYVLYNDSLLIEEDGLAIISNALETKHKFELLNSQLENEQKQSALEYNQLKRTFAILLGSSFIIFLTGFYARLNILNQRREKEDLLKEIKHLKEQGNSTLLSISPKFQLDRKTIEDSINRKINETDWKVLNILFDDPVITNKDIAEKAYLTVDGIGSCLRRMYVAFDIKESKYKKIALIMKAIKISNTSSEVRKEQNLPS